MVRGVKGCEALSSSEGKLPVLSQTAVTGSKTTRAQRVTAVRMGDGSWAV
jgi:hypothetical protein